MNKYDDIKRFIEKSKTEDLDYKELNEKTSGDGITLSMSKWALIKQVSASEELPGLLDNGRTTQPTPQTVSSEEFRLSDAETREPSALASFEPSTAGTTHDVVSPAIVHADLNILETLRATLSTANTAAQPAVQPAVAPQHSGILHAQSVKPESASSLLDAVKNSLPAQATPVIKQPATVSQPLPIAAPSAPVPGSQFRQMFKQKAPQSAGTSLPYDTPLQPLLEMIASCR